MVRQRSYHIYFVGIVLLLIHMVSCVDDDSFSPGGGQLSFSTDTLSMGLVFSHISTPTQTMWVYNRSGKNLRCSSVRLEDGNQTGFRVNVDGTYLSANVGYQVQDVEIRQKDSIRVFVELTSAEQQQVTPQRISSNLVFTLEDGTQQKVNLCADSWDATICNSMIVSNDTMISGCKPIVVYGGITVEQGATLTLDAGTTLYFHQDAGLDVYGTLKCMGAKDEEVMLRGDRLDNMLDNLPYDRMSGQWKGVHFYSSSYDNTLMFTDLHGAFDGIVVDSADVTRQKLHMENCTVHNNQGYGLYAEYAKIQIENTEITNALHDCVYVRGVDMTMNHVTLAQYYPFDLNRDAALSYAAPVSQLIVQNSLITGGADDVLMEQKGGETSNVNVLFDHCIIRTPQASAADSCKFQHVLYEDINDTIQDANKHFIQLGGELLQYDFHLRKTSTAINQANPSTSLPTDRDGLLRDSLPDVGCYEWRE